MAKLAGAALRFLQTALYAILFCCSAIILGFYSYFLAVQRDRSADIPQWQKAVEGIAGAAVVYLIFAVILTCCLGGVRVFAFLAIILDVLFAAAFVAIAVMTRDGARSCSGDVNTPLGNGPADSNAGFGSNGFGTGNNENVTYAVSLGTACRYNKVSFAVSIIAIGLFLISAFVQLSLGRHHQREKRYGPGPSNGYSFRNRFGRRRKGHAAREAELGAHNGY